MPKIDAQRDEHPGYYRMPGEVEEDIEVESKNKPDLIVSKKEKENALNYAEQYNIMSIICFILSISFAAIAAGGVVMLPMLVLTVGASALAIVSMLRRRYWRKIAAIAVANLSDHDLDKVAKDVARMIKYDLIPKR